jgi:flagellar motor switch protein FliM
LDGNWILDIAPSLSYAIIDRMLGGDPKPSDTLRRPLTEIENRLIGRIVDIFLNQLKESWENIVELDLKVESVESNPQLVQIVPPNEVVILVGFELMLAQNRGMLNLCIPFNTIENYNSKLSRNGWVGYGKAAPTQETKGKITSSIDRAPVDVVVTLARSKIRTSDLLDLAVGDIITTEKEVKTPLELAVQNVPKYNATAWRLQRQESCSDRIYDRKKQPQWQAMIGFASKSPSATSPSDKKSGKVKKKKHEKKS